MKAKYALAIAVACLICSAAQAYNPPVDSAGPLVVRIEGPEVVTQVDTALPVRVLLENKGDVPLAGTLELGLVDRWRAEPSEPVRFSLPAGGKTVHEFKVTAGRGTYGDVHYPIHASARFELNGRRRTAHPILILKTKFPRPPKSMAPVQWKPVDMPNVGQLALWRVPVNRVVVQAFGEKPLVMPVGWQGSEPRSRGSFHIGRHTPPDGQSREMIGMHPPYAAGHVGTMLVEFPLVLPKTVPIGLSFATAVRPEGKGDGVTFRVRAVPLDAPAGQFGEILFERHSASTSWQPGEADLSKLAGQSIRLQLESHPGPKNNTGWDQSYWAEPVLTIGELPAPVAFPPNDNSGSQVLGTLKRGANEYEVRIWPGRRGLLDTVVGFSSGGDRLCFRGFSVRVAGDQLEDTRSPTLLVEAKQEPTESGYRVRHRFKGMRGTFEVVGRLYIEQDTLKASFRLENGPPPEPWRVVRLEDMAAGPWSRSALRVYAGHGNVVCRPEAYRMSFGGHRLATSFVGFDFADGLSLVQATDVPPSHLDVDPAERHYSLHVADSSVTTFIPDANVWNAARLWHDVNGLKAAGGVRKAAGRFVFDLWGGRYGESAELLRAAFRYGLTDSMVIWHNWQRWGYDYRLPDIYPSNPKLGTLEEMRELIGVCKEAGVPFGLHDNYIDFYPDAEQFSYDRNIAFHPSGEPVKAWINEGRDARSYRYRSDRIAPFLKRNVKLIGEHLGATAFFIDVWTSVRPYEYWTADGRFFTSKYTRDTWGELFSWIRDTLGDDAPQNSEAGHDQLIGHLDGADAQHFRVGRPMSGKLGWCVLNWRCADAERTPWFDAAHHDRFILHGAGYSGRYQGGLDSRLHGIYSDDYMATEVLTGHPAMVPSPFGYDVVRKYWLLGELMRALAMRRIEGVEFVDGDIHRQHIRWSGGAEVWVNRGRTDWNVAGHALPEFGFLASVPTERGTVEASISRREGVIVETARSADRLYVNGRRIVANKLSIQPTVKELKYLGERKFELSLVWQADDPIPAGWSPFVHFGDAAGEIAFQASHQPGTFETERKGRIVAKVLGRVPGDLKPGATFELLVGIYNRTTGQRLALSGPDDGERRIRLGTVQLKGESDQLDGVAWTPHESQPDPWLARQNPDAKPINFGPVTTAGGCRISPQGRALLITPLPTDRGPEFTVRLRYAALDWNLPEPKFVETLDRQGKVVDRRPVERKDGFLHVICRPGVFAYRLTAE